MEEEFSAGDKVFVPWGLDELPGEIVEVHPTGLGRRIVVRVEVPGDSEADEELLVTLPASAIIPTTSNATPAASGSWASALHYERQVLDALHRLEPHLPLRTFEGVQGRNVGMIDFVVDVSPVSSLYVEAKYRTDGRIDTDAVKQLARFASEGNKDAYLLLISNVDLKPGAWHLVESLRDGGIHIRAVTWQGGQDDHELLEALDDLISETPPQ